MTGIDGMLLIDIPNCVDFKIGLRKWPNFRLVRSIIKWIDLMYVLITVFVAVVVDRFIIGKF